MSDGSWLSTKQSQLLRDPDSISSNHRATHERRVQQKANEQFIDLLNHLPGLVDYVSDASKEQIQEEIDPFETGWALAQLFSRDQLLTMAIAFAWVEQEPGETDEEFTSRLPTILDEFSEDLQVKSRRSEINFGGVDLVKQIADEVFERIEQEVQRRRENADVDMAVPAHRIARWATEQESIEGCSDLQKLLKSLLSGWDGEFRRKIKECERVLINVGERDDVTTPRGGEDVTLEEKWARHRPPRKADKQQYVAAVSGLDDDIRFLIEYYWQRQNVVARDRLVSKSFSILDGLTKHDEQILEWEDRTNRREDWTRHYTKRANVLTDSRDPPLLSREQTSSNYEEWEVTAFGKFVSWLLREEIEHSEIERDGFPIDAPEAVVESAIKQFDNGGAE